MVRIGAARKGRYHYTQPPRTWSPYASMVANSERSGAHLDRFRLNNYISITPWATTCLSRRTSVAADKKWRPDFFQAGTITKYLIKKKKKHTKSTEKASGGSKYYRKGR